MPNIYFTDDVTSTLDNPDSEDENLISASNQEILKYISKSVTELNVDALSQIYKIVKDQNEKITMKKDAILINLGTLQTETVRLILLFIRYLRKNTNVLLEDEILKDQYKTEFKQ